MNDVIFRLSVLEPDGTTGLIELTPAMEQSLYQFGLKEMENSEDEAIADGESGVPFLTIEWDESITEVNFGDSQISPERAAEVIGIGVIRAIVTALDEARVAEQEYAAALKAAPTKVVGSSPTSGTGSTDTGVAKHS